MVLSFIKNKKTCIAMQYFKDFVSYFYWTDCSYVIVSSTFTLLYRKVLHFSDARISVNLLHTGSMEKYSLSNSINFSAW